jgi:hypothetical protein
LHSIVADLKITAWGVAEVPAGGVYPRHALMSGDGCVWFVKVGVNRWITGDRNRRRAVLPSVSVFARGKEFKPWHSWQ